MTNQIGMQEKNIEKVSVQQRIIRIVSLVLLYTFLGLMALTVLFPFYWMLISSVKSLPEYMLQIPTFFPREIIWRNYVDAFNTANLGRLFLNTLYVGVVSTLLSLVVTVLSAFAEAATALCGREIRVQLTELKKEAAPHRDLDELKAHSVVKFM